MRLMTSAGFVRFRAACLRRDLVCFAVSLRRGLRRFIFRRPLAGFAIIVVRSL